MRGSAQQIGLGDEIESPEQQGAGVLHRPERGDHDDREDHREEDEVVLISPPY